jgi:hypothetical protein
MVTADVFKLKLFGANDREKQVPDEEDGNDADDGVLHVC